jgi:hypothetical protein
MTELGMKRKQAYKSAVARRVKLTPWVSRGIMTSGALGTKTTSDESDQTVFDDYKKKQIQMPSKQLRIKLPAMRMLDTGEPADVQKLKTYVHELFGHLG